MRLDNWIIGLLIFGVVMVTGMLVITDFNQNYNVNMTVSQFNESYNITSQIYNITTAQEEKILGGQISEDDALDSALKKADSAFKLTDQSFDLFGAITRDLSRGFGVPTYWIDVFLSMMLITLIFTIIAMIIRFQGF